jgi:hypothetical protein
LLLFLYLAAKEDLLPLVKAPLVLPLVVVGRAAMVAALAAAAAAPAASAAKALEDEVEGSATIMFRQMVSMAPAST